MICLLKQLGDLTMDEMKRKTTLIWRSTPTTYSWWTKYAWILIILMIGVFGGVRSAPGLGGVRSAPGPRSDRSLGYITSLPPMIVNTQLRSKHSDSPSTV